MPRLNLIAEACNLPVKFTAFRCKGRFAVLVSTFKMLLFLFSGWIGPV